MSYIKCEDCDFIYECVNYAPCPVCVLLTPKQKRDSQKNLQENRKEEESEEKQIEMFFDGEQEFEMKAVA